MTDYGNGFRGDYLGVDQWGSRSKELPYQLMVAEPSLGGWNFIGYEPEFVAWADARGGRLVRAEPPS